MKLTKSILEGLISKELDNILLTEEREVADPKHHLDQAMQHLGEAMMIFATEKPNLALELGPIVHDLRSKIENMLEEFGGREVESLDEG